MSFEKYFTSERCEQYKESMRDLTQKKTDIESQISTLKKNCRRAPNFKKKLGARPNTGELPPDWEETLTTSSPLKKGGSSKKRRLSRNDVEIQRFRV